MVMAAAAGGPSWTDIMTAFGTVGAVVAAVGIALWSGWRARAQLAEERQVALEREQRAEAYRVQVISAYTRVGGRSGDPVASVRRLAAMVVNHGNYTITDVEAVFVFNGRSGPARPQRSVYVPGINDLPPEMRANWAASEGYAMESILTPRGTGIRFESEVVPERDLENPYPVVRWADWWGTRWEHRRGVVRRAEADGKWLQ